MPDLSIITPSFMQSGFLEDALDSVEHQSSGFSVEHIVCDGGSTDGTVELLGLSAARWVSEPDSGQSDALNKGLSMAEGEIIGWLNADDYYLDGAFKKVLRHFSANPEVDVVYGDCLFVDERGGVVRGKAEHAFSRTLLRHYGCFIPSTSTFFRRSLIERGLLRIDESFHYVMDYELFMYLSANGARFAYLPEYLAAFRWHEANKSLDDARRLSERKAVQDMYGVRPRSSLGRSITYRFARGLHLLAKAESGGLRRQREALRGRGEDTRWWRAK